jgi:cytoskeletal protein CcmA (bactofilin family)
MLNTIPKTPTDGGSSHGTTVIHSGMRVEGKLITSGDVLIEGTVSGEVKGHNVTIAKGAKVLGKISADEVVIDGTIEGTVMCMKLRINTDAAAKGEFTQSILSVAPGAIFEGTIHQKNSSTPKIETKSL